MAHLVKWHTLLVGTASTVLEGTATGATRHAPLASAPTRTSASPAPPTRCGATVGASANACWVSTATRRGRACSAAETAASARARNSGPAPPACTTSSCTTGSASTSAPLASTRAEAATTAAACPATARAPRASTCRRRGACRAHLGGRSTGPRACSSVPAVLSSAPPGPWERSASSVIQPAQAAQAPVLDRARRAPRRPCCFKTPACPAWLTSSSLLAKSAARSAATRAGRAPVPAKTAASRASTDSVWIR
uniref:Secreted protein n=1 Tax=Ixodes scapularis TaxID=6945 RepID=A0A4D5RAG4_IXOSC